MGRRSLLAAALAGALTLGGAAFAAPTALAALPSNCTQTGRTVSCSYAETGAEQTFTVPTGVTSVQVSAVGEAGSAVRGGGGGGQGGSATGTLGGLAGGSTLYVEVGGAPELISGVFRSGGGGGIGAGDGGGASDVRTAPSRTEGSLGTRLVIAVGGGGGGSGGGVFVGGAGGAAGAPGASTNAAGGGGATATAGGTGGSGNANSGRAGELGLGGVGVDGPAGGSSGGGGDGLYGGGSGGASVDSGGAGGGGGSSLAPPGGTVGLSSAAPSITISYSVAVTAGAITATSGSGQSAQTGRPFAQPLIATVTDPTDGSPVPGAPVTFRVTSGSASFSGGGNAATVTTGTDGQASSPTLTGGSTPGQVSVTATTPGVTGAATFTETVTAAPVAAAVTVKGGGTLTATDGQRYSMSVNARATATGQPSGTFALAGGGAETTASSRTVTAVKKTVTGATVSGTAVNSRGQIVAFTLTVVDGPGGRDQVTVQLGGRTVTGTLTTGDVTTG